MTADPALAAPQSDAGHSVGADVVCITCGYNLRSLPRDGRCPECGAGVADSLLHHEAEAAAVGVPLWRADRRWLRTLRRAALLLLVAAAGQALVYLLILPTWRGALPPQTPVLVRVVLFTTPELLAYVAAWRLMAAEPTSARAAATAVRIRWGARAAVAGSLGVHAYMMFMAFTGNPSVYSGLFPMLARCGLDAAATAFAFTHLARLARRADRPRLARAARATALSSPLLLLPVIPPARYLFLAGVYYGMYPAPVFGYVEAVVPVVMRVHLGGLGWDLVIWSVLAAQGLCCTALVFCFRRVFGSELARAAGAEPRVTELVPHRRETRSGDVADD